jgi:hypothetical protein
MEPPAGPIRETFLTFPPALRACPCCETEMRLRRAQADKCPLSTRTPLDASLPHSKSAA